MMMLDAAFTRHEDSKKQGRFRILRPRGEA
jgi:hypothetical protein